MKQFSYSAKVVIIGDSGVGKTNLLLRLCENTFKTNYVATIGVDFKNKSITLEDGTIVKLQIWDTAGQERYRTIQSTYYKGAAGIVLVYSIDDRKSFTSIQSWIRQVSDYASPQIPKILVANKCDMQSNERRVSTQQGAQLAQTFSARFLEVSAKDGTNVFKVFERLAHDISSQLVLEKRQSSSSRGINSSEMSRRSADRKQKQRCDC